MIDSHYYVQGVLSVSKRGRLVGLQAVGDAEVSVTVKRTHLAEPRPHGQSTWVDPRTCIVDLGLVVY